MKVGEKVIIDYTPKMAELGLVGEVVVVFSIDGDFVHIESPSINEPLKVARGAVLDKADVQAFFDKHLLATTTDFESEMQDVRIRFAGRVQDLKRSMDRDLARLS